MWVDYFMGVSDDSEFAPAATEPALTEAEATLNLKQPAELRDLLQETNGVEQPSAYLLFILSAERIERDNDEMRHVQALSGYLPFNNNLFFADAGNGDKFGFSVSQDGNVREDVFLWNHEDDRRSWCVPSLKVFI